MEEELAPPVAHTFSCAGASPWRASSRRAVSTFLRAHIHHIAHMALAFGLDGEPAAEEPGHQLAARHAQGVQAFQDGRDGRVHEAQGLPCPGAVWPSGGSMAWQMAPVAVGGWWKVTATQEPSTVVTNTGRRERMHSPI
jgi:hypothetical protein